METAEQFIGVLSAIVVLGIVSELVTGKNTVPALNALTSGYVNAIKAAKS